MTRLIDADALIENYFSDSHNIALSYADKCWMRRIIQEAPTIDAVPVVRCKTCIKWEADGSYEFDDDGTKRLWGVCSNSLHHCKDNHYCSYGERKEEKHE